MKREKIKLNNLKVKSFLTYIQPTGQARLAGGIMNEGEPVVCPTDGGTHILCNI